MIDRIAILHSNTILHLIINAYPCRSKGINVDMENKYIY